MTQDITKKRWVQTPAAFAQQEQTRWQEALLWRLAVAPLGIRDPMGDCVPSARRASTRIRLDRKPAGLVLVIRNHQRAAMHWRIVRVLQVSIMWVEYVSHVQPGSMLQDQTGCA